ncbi:hypothetical protein N7457_000072 [Penicillium paradoxum]|uniref:uncharacterized protein n=1 Tax=Penicillium paradoxum TaxID=176176 RepID=UPI002546FE7B|nr:uncharacterized protein N7457_000072 [Penicillium paradoxum]KAJ5793473.1 hypothetical protein N7457_000072 [Penicillium paradoxum]
MAKANIGRKITSAKSTTVVDGRTTAEPNDRTHPKTSPGMNTRMNAIETLFHELTLDNQKLREENKKLKTNT